MPRKKYNRNNPIYGSGTEIYEYVRRNKDRLPDYWQEKGVRVCIEGVCCMIARDKYTDQEIAEFYECPVPLIESIRMAYIKTIRKLRKEHKETAELFGDAYLNPTQETNDNLGYVELLSLMLGR